MTSISGSFGGARTTPARPWAAAGSRLLGRRGLYVLTLVLVAAGLALGGAWWGFAAVLPLLYALPCAAMIAMCMNGHGGSGQSTGAKPDSTSTLAGGPTAGEAGPR